MKYAIIFTLLLCTVTVWGANLKKELPTIRPAAERNGIESGSDDFYLLLAIRMAENGGAGREFGIMDKRAYNLDLQAAWCSCTIMKHHKRFGSPAVTAAFIDDLGDRYCPVGADNDNGTNKYWKKNVKYWYRRLKNV